MPLPLIAIAGAALLGAVGYAGYRYYQGLRAGSPPSLGELGRAALVGGVVGTLAGTAAVGATLGLGAVGTTSIVVPSSLGVGNMVRVADDFVDDGRVNGSDRARTSTARTTPAVQPAPRTSPAARPLFGSAEARDLLAAQLEQSERERVAAGVPSADQVAGAMAGIADQIRGGSAPAGGSRTAPAPTPQVPTDLDQAAAVLNGITDAIEAQRRDRAAPPPPPASRGMTAALRGGTGQ